MAIGLEQGIDVIAQLRDGVRSLAVHVVSEVRSGRDDGGLDLPGVPGGVGEYLEMLAGDPGVRALRGKDLHHPRLIRAEHEVRVS